MTHCLYCGVGFHPRNGTQFCSAKCDFMHEQDYEEMCEQEREQLLSSAFETICPCCDKPHVTEDPQVHDVCDECVVALAEREKMYALLPIFCPNRADCTCIPF